MPIDLGERQSTNASLATAETFSPILEKSEDRRIVVIAPTALRRFGIEPMRRADDCRGHTHRLGFGKRVAEVFF